ncbi:Fatty acid desaturase [Cupriavidus necator H850]|nr:Fatty acid desaturase [Cupriavidus necator H850]
MHLGFLSLPWWGYALVTLGLTHVTIASVTIFLHRHQAHRALDLHPIASHFLRFWLWLTTGMVTREWVAIHRKHHAKCETPEDPHSPQFYGIWRVLLEGAELYRSETRNAATLQRYGHDTPDDWIERNLYAKTSTTPSAKPRKTRTARSSTASGECCWKVPNSIAVRPGTQQRCRGMDTTPRTTGLSAIFMRSTSG